MQECKLAARKESRTLKKSSEKKIQKKEVIKKNNAQEISNYFEEKENYIC